MQFDELIEKTRKVVNGFDSKFTKQDRLIDLMEEVGELAQATLIVDGKKHTNDPNKQKTVEDVADALCDVMCNLVLLADDYNVDLPREYSDMLDRLNKRIEGGEFVKNE